MKMHAAKKDPAFILNVPWLRKSMIFFFFLRKVKSNFSLKMGSVWTLDGPKEIPIPKLAFGDVHLTGCGSANPNFLSSSEKQIWFSFFFIIF